MQVQSRPGSPWQAGSLQDLRYHGRGRVSAFTASGRRVFDLGTTLSYSSLTSTTVDYLNQTWWPARISGLPPRPGPVRERAERRSLPHRVSRALRKAMYRPGA